MYKVDDNQLWKSPQNDPKISTRVRLLLLCPRFSFVKRVSDIRDSLIEFIKFIEEQAKHTKRIKGQKIK